LKALAKDPAGRYQTAEDFDRALVQVSEALRSGPVAALAQALTVPSNGGGLTDATTRLQVPAAFAVRPAEPLIRTIPAVAASSTAPASVLVLEANPVQEPDLKVGRVNCPAPVRPGDSASLPGLPTGAGLLAPARRSSVSPQTTPGPVPSVAPAPAFLVAGSNAPISKQQLIIGATAGASVGVLLVALWLFAK